MLHPIAALSGRLYGDVSSLEVSQVCYYIATSSLVYSTARVTDILQYRSKRSWSGSVSMQVSWSSGLAAATHGPEIIPKGSYTAVYRS